MFSNNQKDHKEALDDFVCEFQSDLAKTCTQILLSPQKKTFNPFIQKYI